MVCGILQILQYKTPEVDKKSFHESFSCVCFEKKVVRGVKKRAFKSLICTRTYTYINVKLFASVCIVELIRT